VIAFSARCVQPRWRFHLEIDVFSNGTPFAKGLIETDWVIRFN